MNKLFQLFGIAVLSFSLLNCGGSGDSKSGESETPKTETDGSADSGGKTENGATPDGGEESNVTASNDESEHVSGSDEPVSEINPELPVPEADASRAKSGTGVLVHLTEGAADPFKASLALSTASELAESHQVLVYFDQRATEIVLKGSKDFEYNPFPSVKGQIKKLSSMGVELRVCKPCLQAYYKKPSDVMKGVSPMDPAELIDFASGRIVSLDY